MIRTTVAAAVAALFVFSAPSLYAQTSGTSGSASPSASATSSGNGSSAASASKNGASASASSQLDHADRKFIEKAAEDGMKEVEVSRTVADKAADPAVKAFAERMVKDHTDANKKLTDLAQSKGVAVPTELKRGDRHEVDKMSKMDPDKMDRSYMKDQVKDHKRDVKEFEKESKSAKDADVKKFASDTLPTLQEHLQMAEDTEGKLKGGGSAATRRDSNKASTNAAAGDTGRK